ncbi:inositol-tetrakisphosphate 1-kinase [Striga asiatica]|uniref:inositol-1,3,4-trisphosphate 5/6-kinase n=1 Tax=Striga asiatica TaxID=4170 RepID=A0A5A7R7M7_STRAF|nr:inositol-tetrakisphosphate 1-kinase [Striga asiatica]
MGVVRGILVESDLLISPSAGDANGDAVLRPGADLLLRRLRYSKIPFGISHEPGPSRPKECLLQELANTYCCTNVCLSPEDDLSSKVAHIWEGNGGTFIYVVSGCKADIYHKEAGVGWLKVIVGSAEENPFNDPGYDVATGTSNIFIQKLEELLLLICSLNKKAMHGEGLIVGYVMKPSREEDFAKRGAFPLRPTQNGLMFLPLQYELPLTHQLKLVDAVLHKATDEILAVDMCSPSELSEKVTFTSNLQELQKCMKSQPVCCVIDPISNISPILDRLEIQQILIGLEALNIHGRSKIRAPHFLKVSYHRVYLSYDDILSSSLLFGKNLCTRYQEFPLQLNLRLQVDSFHQPYLEQRLAEAKLSLPNIVKPQVACGVSNAHSMAIVFKVDQYKDLNVPLPAVVQEYVDHSSLIYKFYALGSKVFYAVKKSIPNTDILMNLFADKGSKPLHFDSLKSLPVATEQLSASNHQLDLDLVNDAANWLRRTLDLTIFGFDAVIQEGTGDHVIVDVNYLPSFKEVADGVALPAFWDALSEKIASEKNKQSNESETS